MKIALVQINPIIGDFAGNGEKIISYTKMAKNAGCGLVIFPELALCGYPPKDLLERRAFLVDHDATLNGLVREIDGIGVILGGLTRHSGLFGKPLHNSAFLIESGTVTAVHKRLLPTYDVFDESRYFEPAKKSQVLFYRGLRLGVTICEDIFNEPSLLDKLNPCGIDDSSCTRTLYQDNPVADLMGASGGGVDVLINIAASPFHSGKPMAKRNFFSRLTAKYKIPLLYVNQVGGQDSLVFDGQSLVMDASGHIVAQAASFAEDMIVVDTDIWQECPSRDGFPNKMENSGAVLQDSGDQEVAEIFDALVLGCRDYLAKCGFRQALLGLSGGIDSALTAVVAVHALGKENVLGISLPSEYSSEGSVNDAYALAKNLDIAFQVIPIHDIFEDYLKTLAPSFEGYKADVTEQNIQARIRGNILMALANKHGRLLLSTGNKSEVAVGYCTLYGDMSGGLAVLSDVPKVMVYQICRYLNKNSEIIPWATIDKPPSAELAPDQKDQDDLPPYEILDAILEAHMEEGLAQKEIVARGFDAVVVEDVLRRVRLNEHKRKQAPLGLKVTTKAFGSGRRYPICQKYIEA